MGQKVIPKIVAARAPDANPLRSRRLQSPKNALRHSWREPFIDDQFFLIRPASILRCGLVSALAELAARTVAAAQLVPATSTPSAASHASHTRRRVNRRSRPRCRRADAAVEPSSETVFVWPQPSDLSLHPGLRSPDPRPIGGPARRLDSQRGGGCQHHEPTDVDRRQEQTSRICSIFSDHTDGTRTGGDS